MRIFPGNVMGFRRGFRRTLCRPFDEREREDFPPELKEGSVRSARAGLVVIGFAG
jgi:hypothetical protein